MNNPSFSFFLAFLVWILIVGFFSFSFFKQKSFLEPEITIDAQMIGELNSEEKKLSSKNNFLKNNHGDEKTPDLNKDDFEKQNHHNNNSTDGEKKAKIVYRPLPQIPEYLRQNVFETKAVAKFYILKSGEVKDVKLIQPSNNPRLNFMLLSSLKKWRFEESDKESTQDIEVTFEVN